MTTAPVDPVPCKTRFRVGRHGLLRKERKLTMPNMSLDNSIEVRRRLRNISVMEREMTWGGRGETCRN